MRLLHFVILYFSYHRRKRSGKEPKESVRVFSHHSAQVPPLSGCGFYRTPRLLSLSQQLFTKHKNKESDARPQVGDTLDFCWTPLVVQGTPTSCMNACLVWRPIQPLLSLPHKQPLPLLMKNRHGGFLPTLKSPFLT